MICHKIGAPPISIIGFGLKWLSSLILVPNPPAKITTFIPYPSNPHIGNCYFLLAFRYSDGDSVVKRLNTEEK